MALSQFYLPEHLLCGLQQGHVEGQVGCQRVVTLDGKSYVQELTALDDNKHIQ